MVKLAGAERKLQWTEINRLLMIWYCLMSHLLVCMGGLQVNVEKSKMMISGEET